VSKFLKCCVVSEPAGISEHTQSISVTEGDPATLECRFSGSKPLKSRWMKAGEELRSGQKYLVQRSDISCILTILKTQSRDSGQYSCEVSNEAGRGSCEATVTVLGQFYPLLTLPESMNVLPGSNVQFKVVVSGSPPLTMKWFKNRKEVLSSADCSMIKDNTSSLLQFFSAKTSDSGRYICEIHNDVGSTSCQTTLLVKEISVRWFRDGVEVQQSVKHMMSFCSSVATLQISNVTENDSGKYFCEACNDAGTESCTAELVVKGLSSSQSLNQM
uniref:Ig-like domain-containing protein n=1 Tax=Sphaeramia orbicularis TaxID=375764 RepID=A0A673ARL3_9TELE